LPLSWLAALEGGLSTAVHEHCSGYRQGSFLQPPGIRLPQWP